MGRDDDESQIPNIGGVDFLDHGKGCVISLQERTMVPTYPIRGSWPAMTTRTMIR